MQNTPDHSLIISGIDPVYLEYLVGNHSQRQVIPISRRVEYASKLIAAKKIPHPEPSPVYWGDHRCQGLINGGAKEAVPRVALEDLNGLRNELAKGTRVFLDTTYLVAEEAKMFDGTNQFKLSLCTNSLYEVHLDGH